jgi:hypothetical protein
MVLTYLAWTAFAFVVYNIISTITTRRRNAAAAKRLACGSSPMEYWPDPFALTNLFRTMRALSNNTVLEYMRSTFDNTSANRTVQTYETKILGDQVIFTSDPKNIQAMLATQFRDFELGQVRRGSFAPLWVAFHRYTHTYCMSLIAFADWVMGFSPQTASNGSAHAPSFDRSSPVIKSVT